ncbi:MAG: UvrD-helicase domain-containing protein [Candidatus Cloacimonetes bacterium]|nr:UvrD-helicase domain-containing protein [Candidatus Cloacimonadota bacterium]
MYFLSELNTQQAEVVQTTEGPLLVLAGAGSGKTRSVIYRAAYLIEVKKVPPWNLLILTFTNKAARELIERLEKRFSINTRSLWIGTFHSICARILRRESSHLPFSASFSIYDDDDQQAVFRKLYKEMKIDSKVFPVSRIRYIISRQKNSLILPEQFLEFNEKGYYADKVLEIYQAYQQLLRKNNALDFDDLLLYTAYLLNDNSEIRSYYEKTFRYVMIDEYQDTNYAQFKIVNLITANHQNICVVGDDDQAIYSWRGASIRNILEFEKDYRAVRKIKLEQNYRSPQIILKLANSLIRHNSERHAKELWTELESKILPRLVRLDNDSQEAEFVAHRIIELKKNSASLNDFVVLYRTNAQSRNFEKVFSLYKIKYQIVGGVNFYQRKEIKDILAYLRVLVNPDDNESLLRIINYPARKIGEKTIGYLLDRAVENSRNLLGEIIDFKPEEHPAGISTKISSFSHLIQRLLAYSRKKPVSAVIKRIITATGISDLYNNSDDPQDISRLENLNEFIAAGEEFAELYEQEFGSPPSIAEFIQNISLQTDLDTVDEEAEAVRLMTMHNAKGLEFEHVFIVGLEDGLLPHSRSLDSSSQLEEERRLLYVAITRARKSLYLTYAETRRLQDIVGYTMPSRFILEMDKDCLETEPQAAADRYRPTGKSFITKKEVITESQKYFKVGQKIIHGKFGSGVVLSVEGKGKDAKLTISFSGGELKKVIGSFVRIQDNN